MPNEEREATKTTFRMFACRPVCPTEGGYSISIAAWATDGRVWQACFTMPAEAADPHMERKATRLADKIDWALKRIVFGSQHRFSAVGGYKVDTIHEFNTLFRQVVENTKKQQEILREEGK
ncbi:MAG: hypothetical protein L0387_00025 [Acidobacteria bacterium]|nr:hypothetical protein [Acidobacteriota bacterium]